MAFGTAGPQSFLGLGGNEWPTVVADVLMFVLGSQVEYSLYDIILQQCIHQCGGGATGSALLENLIGQGSGSEPFQVAPDTRLDFIVGGTEIASLYFGFGSFFVGTPAIIVAFML